MKSNIDQYFDDLKSLRDIQHAYQFQGQLGDAFETTLLPILQLVFYSKTISTVFIKI